MFNCYYRPAGQENCAIIVVREKDEDSESSYGISPGHAREWAARDKVAAPFRNELIAAAERYVLDALAS